MRLIAVALRYLPRILASLLDSWKLGNREIGAPEAALLRRPSDGTRRSSDAQDSHVSTLEILTF